MTNSKKKINFIIDELNRLYPDAKCSLNYTTPYELLIATRLSAQCTDERVNKVTPELFSKYTTLEDYANADYDDICKIIHSCGFYRGKAQSIIEMSKQILENYNGIVPDNIDDLTKLSGIGRKTANLICGDIYGKPAIIADTHCIRLSNRLGFVEGTDDPKKVEMKLKEIIPDKHQTKLCHNLVHHGRAVCTARNPQCDICSLNSVCVFFKSNSKIHDAKTKKKQK